MFEKHKKAIQLGGTPYITPIEAGRGYADGETIPIPDTDWSGESLVAVIATAPGQPSLATFSVAIATEQKTWQDYKDECVPCHFFPCGVDYTETITTTLMTISWSVANLSLLPSPDMAGEPVIFYMEIRRADGTGPRFAAGDFVLTERVR